MGYFVIAVGNHPISGREGWDVTGDRHAQTVSFRGHWLDPLWIDGIVDFQLPVTPMRIPLHIPQRICQVIDNESEMLRVGAFSLDEAIRCDSRPCEFAVFKAGHQ